MLMGSNNGVASVQQMENILNNNYNAIDGLFTLKEERSTNTFNLGENTAWNRT